MVIFTPSSRSTSLSGDGKKSLTTSSRPSGSSRYLRLRFINLLSSAPVSGTNNANHIAAVCKPYGEHAATSFSKAIKPWLALTVREILGDDTCWIQESELRVHKRHAVLPLVLRVLGRIPLEAWAHRRKYNRRMGLTPYADMGACRPLTVALSGRMPTVGTRRERTMYQGACGALVMRFHGPLERVVRGHLGTICLRRSRYALHLT